MYRDDAVEGEKNDMVVPQRAGLPGAAIFHLLAILTQHI
jgi:hypothetical protein